MVDVSSRGISLPSDFQEGVSSRQVPAGREQLPAESGHWPNLPVGSAGLWWVMGSWCACVAICILYTVLYAIITGAHALTYKRGLAGGEGVYYFIEQAVW